MSIDKNIRFTADATQVENAFKRIQDSAQESANVLMQEAEKRGGSTKEMLKYLEDEIKAMERSNRLYVERRTLEVRDKMTSHPNDKDLKKELREINVEDRESRLQTELLRDIIDTLIKTSREEIEENKKGVTERVQGTPVSSRDFRTRLQASLLGIEQLDQDKGRKINEADVARGRFAYGMRGYGSAVVGSNNLYDAGLNVANMAGSQMMSSGLPIAGAALALGAIIGKAVFDTYQKYRSSASLSYALMGRSSTDLGLGYSDWGYTGADFMGSMERLTRMRRSGTGAEAATRHQLAMQRGIGLDISSYGAMEQLSMVSGGSGYANIQSSIAAMRAAGIVRDDDMSPVQDYLAIIANLGKEQLTRLGSVDVGVNSKMVSALANVDDNLKKSPEALTTLVNSIKGGLTGGSPQSQALQYSVLSKMAPGASMFELMEMRENPFSQKSLKYMPEFLKQLREVSGSDDRFYMNIMQQFGLSARMSRKLGEGYISGDIEEILNKDFVGEEGVVGLEERAKSATPFKEREVARLENMTISIGEGLIKIDDKMNSLVGAVEQNNAKLSEVADEVTKQGGLGNRIVGTLMSLPPRTAF